MSKMIIVLNKIDMIPEENRAVILAKKIEGLRKVFSKTKFGSNLPIIPVAAMVGADDS